MEQTPNIAICPAPGLSHLIPLIELAKRLYLHHHFKVTFLIPNDHGSLITSTTQILQTLPKHSFSSILLPPVNVDDLPENAELETRLPLIVIRSLNSIKETLKKLAESNRVCALVVDLFGTSVALDVKNELGVPPYIFFPSTAMGLTLIFHMKKIDEMFTCEFRDMPNPVELPGSVSVHGRDFPDTLADRTKVPYKMLLESLKYYHSVDGIIVNSYMDLESGSFKALKDGSFCKTSVYHVGPLVESSSHSSIDQPDCLQWLDKQPSGSVLYVSFGSGGALSHKQITELALGLEMSGQQFLWVVRSPNDEHANANYFNFQPYKDPFGFLPEGFLDRTSGSGYVVSSWAPQVKILSHDSTGGFLTHCGWNSTLESIVHGIPLIAWPLYAEQKLNAVLLADYLKVAWRVKENENDIVVKEEIAMYAKRLIEHEDGKMLRNRMKALKDAASKALSEDGSSTKSLYDVAQKLKQQ